MAGSKAPASVRRCIDTLTSIRRLAGLSPVTKELAVELALKRMHRRYGRHEAQALPLTRDVLAKLLAVCGKDTQGLRNQVLLRMGYESMRRRAELCQFRFEDITRRRDGRAALVMRFSKTDQFGRGKLIPISKELDELLVRWAVHVGGTGFILRGVRDGSGGHVPMSSATINLRLRALQKRSSIDLGGWLSGHSFRVGAALDMLNDGVSMEKIMLRGGWKSESTVIRYLRAWDPMDD